MSVRKAAAPYVNRRLQKRYTLAPDSGADVRFSHPYPNGLAMQAPLRDISLSGLSIVLPSEIPAAEVGVIVKGVSVRVNRKTFRGDLLIMHLTPANEPGAICGGLFYPEGDEDLITIRLVVKALDAIGAAGGE